MSSKMNTGIPQDFYRKLKDLTTEQIKQLCGGDYVMLVAVFMMEISEGSEPFLDSVKTFERWMPLLREERFLQILEKRISEMEAQTDVEGVKKWFRQILWMARELHHASDDETRQYFESRSTLQGFEKARTEDLATQEYENALKAVSRGDLQGALTHYKRAVDAYAHTNDDQMIAQCLLNSGNVLFKLGRVSQAEQYYRRAMTMLEQLGDTVNLALAYCNLGYVMLETGQLDEAYESAKQGFRILRTDVEGAENAAMCVTNLMLAVVRQQLMPPTEKTRCYLQLVQLLKESELKSVTSRTLVAIGGDLAALHEYDKAYEVVKTGVRLMVTSGLPYELVQEAIPGLTVIGIRTGRPQKEVVAEINKLLGIPNTVVYLGDLIETLVRDIVSGRIGLDQARHHMEKAHADQPFDEQAVATIEASVSNRIDLMQLAPLDAEQVLNSHDVAYIQLLLTAARLAGSRQVESKLHFDWARLYDKSGRFLDAAQEFEHAAELARLCNNENAYVSMRLNHAEAMRRAGNWPVALELTKAILEDSELSDSCVQLPAVYLKLSRLYRGQNRIGKAEETALKGLQLAEALAEDDSEAHHQLQSTAAELHSVVGLVYKDIGRFVGAEKHFWRSLQLHRELRDRESEVITLGNLAAVKRDTGNAAEASALYNQAYQMIRTRDPKPSYGPIYSGRALGLSSTSQNAEARRMANIALEIKSLPTPFVAESLFVLLVTAQTDAESQDAYRKIDNFLRTTSELMWHLPLLFRLIKQTDSSPRQKDGWKKKVHEIVENLNGLPAVVWNARLADLQEDDELGHRAAIGYLQKTLTLIDELAARNPTFEVRRGMFEHASTAAVRLLQLNRGSEKVCLETVLRAKARATLSQRFVTARTIEELQSQLKCQAEAILLIEMYELEKETLLFFVTAEGLQAVESMQQTSVSMIREDNGVITRLGDQYRYKTAWRSKPWERMSTEFGDLVSRHAEPGQLICLVPSGFWHFLPLHACFVDDSPLAESHPVFYGPSSCILSRPGDPMRALRRCLTVGMEFENEARWVADWFGARVMPGSLAEPEVIAGALEDEDVVHFACHGSYAFGGDQSGLKLAHHGWLTPKIIEQYTTSADLVTLAACETAFDFVTGGNDLVGLDMAFLNMGAVSVLGTLWKVETKSTEQFVKAFYTFLTGQRHSNAKQMSKAHALQAAITEIRKDERFAHPYYWAPFKLSGGWL